MKKLLLLFLAAFILSSCAKPSNKTIPSDIASYSKFPVLEYHLIGTQESRWTRTPQNLRGDIEWLYKNNYYPANLKDILNSFKDVPKGKTPIVLTFDDSSTGQFRYLPNHQVDPDSAVGIIKTFHDKHGNDWPMRATFFVLIETNSDDRNIFGQPEHPEYKAEKLKQLASWGMEIGSHTYSHERLDKLSDEKAKKTLERSVKTLSEFSSSEIVSLGLPLGMKPKNMSLLNHFKILALVSGGFQSTIESNSKLPIEVKRIQAIDSEWRSFFKRKD